MSEDIEGRRGNLNVGPLAFQDGITIFTPAQFFMELFRFNFRDPIHAV